MYRCCWLLVVAATIALAGCAQDKESRRAQEDYRAQQEAGGSLPWNRPQSWEGGGALGSQVNQFSR